MVSQSRAKKIAIRIQETLAHMLTREISDPRLQNITITDLEVDRELAYATIYITAGEDADQNEIMQTLRGAKGFLRSELSSQIELRSFPQLRFEWDDSIERGNRIDMLLDQIHKGDSLAGDKE